MPRPDDLDPPDPDDLDDDPVADSLWERLATEAVGPLRLELPHLDADGVAAWTIQAPDSDGVCELDQLTNALDVVDALLGGDDLADEVIDHLERLPFSATISTATQLRRHWALDQDLPPGMWQDIVEQIDCYGDAIERDLALGGIGHTGGIDLLDWWRGRRPWPQLLRLITGLPDGSRYVAALLDDEDLAAARLDAGHERPDTPARPGLEGETQDRSLRRAMVSALLRIEHATYAVHAGKKAGKPPRSLPGPETAEDRLRERIADLEVEDLFDQATPGWRAGDDSAPPAGYQQLPSGLIAPDT